MNRRAGAGVALGLIVLIAIVAYLRQPQPQPQSQSQSIPQAQTASARSLGLPPLPPSLAVELTAARVALGRKLFFDRRLSFNGTMSCAMCHVPEEGFTSHASKLAVGMEGKSLRRNAPTLLNVAYQPRLFHDGRETSLVNQVWLPLLHPDEMANPSIGHVLKKFVELPDYANLFERAFDSAPASMETVGRALAAYQATLAAADSRFDRWQFAQDRAALSEEEKRGLAVFTGKGRCAQCHVIGAQYAVFTDNAFHVTGAGLGAIDKFIVPLAPGVETAVTNADLAAFAQSVTPDLGRFEITHNAADRYAFRTPTLRNVAHTAPYMHDGSIATLEEVVKFYDRGGNAAPGKSALITPLRLSAEEKTALVVFLRALSASDLTAIVQQSRN
jgi:cytochrome c peroxidase